MIWSFIVVVVVVWIIMMLFILLFVPMILWEWLVGELLIWNAYSMGGAWGASAFCSCKSVFRMGVFLVRMGVVAVLVRVKSVVDDDK